MFVFCLVKFCLSSKAFHCSPLLSCVDVVRKSDKFIKNYFFGKI